MSTATADAPDISSMGGSPVADAVPDVGETNPFREAVNTATKDLPSPDAVEEAGHNKSPEEVATALQKLRADVSTAFHGVAEDHPDEAYAKRASINEDFNKRIAKQRDAATADWAQKTFPDEESFKNFSTAWDSANENNADSLEPYKKEAQSLREVLDKPEFQPIHSGPLARLKGDDGTPFGWYQAHPDMHGGYDVHVQLNNGEKSGHFKIKGKATKEDITKAFLESPVAKRAGRMGIGASLEDMARGFTTAGLNVASGVAGLVGASDTATALRAKTEQVREAYTGTTRPTTGGHLLRQTGELGGKLPVWALPFGLPAEFYGEGTARGHKMAAELRERASGLATSNPDLSKRLSLAADQFEAHAWIYGAASAAVGLGAGALAALPLKGVIKLLPKSAQEAAGKFIESLGGRIAAETANITAMEAAQGQVVDPLFGYDRAPISNLINPGNILFGAVFGGRRYLRGRKAAAEKEKAESTAKAVQAGDITSPKQIFEAIHGKSEAVEPAPSEPATEPSKQADTTPPEEPPLSDEQKVEQSIRRAKDSADIFQAAHEERLAALDKAQNEATAERQRRAIDLLKNVDKPPGKSAEESAEAMKSQRLSLPPASEMKSVLHDIPLPGDQVVYEGYSGHLAIDAEGRPVVITDDGVLVEVTEGRVEQVKRVEQVPTGTYAFNGKSGWKYEKSNISPNGQLVSVTLRHPDGGKEKVKGPDAYRIAKEQREIAERERGLNTSLAPRSERGHISSAWFEALANGADLIHKGITDFAKWSREMVRRFGAAIQSSLKEIWRHAVQYYYDVIKPASGAAGGTGNTAAKTAARLAKGKVIAAEAEANSRKPMGVLRSNLPWNKRRILKDVEPARKVLTTLQGEKDAGSVAAKALGEKRADEFEKLNKTQFEKYGLLNDCAASLYTQAAGDKSLLKDQRDAYAATGQKKFLPVYDKAIALTPAEVEASNRINGDSNQIRDIGQEAGVLAEGLDNYVHQTWDLNTKANRGKAEAFVSSFNANPSSTKARKIPTLHDGMMEGLEPKVLAKSKLMALNLKEINNAIAARKAAQELAALRFPDGTPMTIIDTSGSHKLDDKAVERLQTLAKSGVSIPVEVRRSIFNDKFAVGGGPEPKYYDPYGFRGFDRGGLKGYFYQIPGADGEMQHYLGKLLFAPEVFPYARAHFGESAPRNLARENSFAGASMRFVFAANREMKASLFGAISAFHYVQEGFHAIGHLTNPLSNLPKFDPLNPEHLQWMKDGLLVGGESDAMFYFDSEMQNKEPYIWRVPVVGWLSKMMSEHLFLHYIPALKLKTAENALPRNMKRFAGQIKNGTMSESEVRRITARMTNDAYGGINWADLGLRKSFRDVLSVLMVAPDFLMARARFAAQALPIQKLRGVDAHNSGREAAMAFIVLASVQFFGARIAEFMMNDGQMYPTGKFKDLFTAVDKKSGRKYGFRTVPGDLLDFIEAPGDFLMRRTSPLVKDAYQVATGTNWRSEQVGRLTAAVDSLLGALPITVQPFVRNLSSTGQQAPISVAEEFARGVGLKINRYSQLGEVKSKAHDYMLTHGAKTGTDFHQPSVYNPMLFHLLDGDDEGAKIELDKLTSKDNRKLERVMKGFHASLFRAYTGDAANDVNFRREVGQNDEGRQLIKDADRQRTEAWNRFVKIAKPSGELRDKYQPRGSEPSEATLVKARDMRLMQAR